MTKKDFFSKLKNYNNELEQILEKKTFSSDIKNLLLNMFYKTNLNIFQFLCYTFLVLYYKKSFALML